MLNNVLRKFKVGKKTAVLKKDVSWDDIASIMSMDNMCRIDSTYGLAPAARTAI